MLELLFLLLPFAAASGWFAAYHHFFHRTRSEKKNFNREYLLGLNYLLNEQPDKAVDTFIKILEVDSETVETHLALGVLFRRRGEIDRAIRLHQNLIARPQLAKAQKTQALLALGQDYYYAGLLDRAERLFAEVVKMGNLEACKAASRYLLEIYQQEKRWEIAIVQAKKILDWDPSIIKNIAHYYCELALQKINHVDSTKEISVYLAKALKYDKKCVRANLIKGELELKKQQWEKAIHYFQAIKKQDPDYITEILEPLTQCYAHCDSGHVDLLDYLYAILAEHSKTAISLTIVKLLQEKDREKASQFLTKQLQEKPSLHGLYHLLELQTNEHSNQTDQEKVNLSLFKSLLVKLLHHKPQYRCLRCGFHSKLLDWFCPACRNWSTIKPDRE